jgi:hypothetical protein
VPHLPAVKSFRVDVQVPAPTARANFAGLSRECRISRNRDSDLALAKGIVRVAILGSYKVRHPRWPQISQTLVRFLARAEAKSGPASAKGPESPRRGEKSAEWAQNRPIRSLSGPSRLREAADTCEFRRVLQRGPKIAACLVERGGFEPPSPFRLWAAENSASSAHYFGKLLRNR